MSRANGGAAFPLAPARMFQDGDAATGMTLRDYFAANAPDYPFDKKIDPLRTGDILQFVAARDADWRYAYADAMLAERAKTTRRTE